MPSTPLQPHYKNARAGKQVFLPPPPPRIYPLPIPVRCPSQPPIAIARQPLTAKTGMTRVELTDRFAELRAALDEKFANLKRINDPLPTTIYKIRDRQDKVVDNINQLAQNQ
jgi:hypothetical protein